MLLMKEYVSSFTEKKNTTLVFLLSKCPLTNKYFMTDPLNILTISVHDY